MSSVVRVIGKVSNRAKRPGQARTERQREKEKRLFPAHRRFRFHLLACISDQAVFRVLTLKWPPNTPKGPGGPVTHTQDPGTPRSSIRLRIFPGSFGSLFPSCLPAYSPSLLPPSLSNLFLMIDSVILFLSNSHGGD